ncbi:hypothetical protein GO009_01035 [Muricauda sp. TY007]|uniref:DUF6418 domain-containing protein n=1 Tax=Allomuricauda sp. TY007 TaxID=2683200 RepID=UPI0013C1A5DB|nr:DUF6418 domain-containing protein [Muricauda sp. TY007]NDV14595.1 hypothetical protein [Muricauda sp. TY007]
MSFFLNISIVLFVIFFSIHRLNKNYKLFYLLLYVYYQGIITSASLTFIETGIYISEQGRESYFVWANLCFLVFFLISIFSVERVFKSLNRHVRFQAPSISYQGANIGYLIIFALGILILGLLLLNLLMSSSPLFDNSVTRFTYWPNSKFPVLRSIFGNTAAFLPFIFGNIYVRRKRSGLMLLLIYIAYLVLIGQKFSPIVRSLYAFFLPWVLTSNIVFKFSVVKFVKSYFSIIFFLIFGLVYVKYSIHNPFINAGAKTPIEAIFYRAFGLQAHLFWGSVEQFVFWGHEKSWDLQELYKGMHVLMRYFWYGDLDHIERSIQNGFSFTNAYPAILLKIFPLGIAYVFHALLVGSVLAPITWLLNVLMVKNKQILSLLTFQFFNWTGISFIMGYFNKAIPGILLILIISFYSFLAFNLKRNGKLS